MKRLLNFSKRNIFIFTISILVMAALSNSNSGRIVVVNDTKKTVQIDNALFYNDVDRLIPVMFHGFKGLSLLSLQAGGTVSMLDLALFHQPKSFLKASKNKHRYKQNYVYRIKIIYEKSEYIADIPFADVPHYGYFNLKASKVIGKINIFKEESSCIVM